MPRSFIGPILIALASYPILVVGKIGGIVKTSADAGLGVRLTLAVLYAASICTFGRLVILGDAAAVPTSGGGGGGVSRAGSLQQKDHRANQRASLVMWHAFLGISAVQFHPMFWAGRPTPNGIVMPTVVVALACVFAQCSDAKQRASRSQTGIALLTASAVVSRIELVGVLAPVALWVAITRQMQRTTVVKDKLVRDQPAGLLPSFLFVMACGALAGFAALAATSVIDTYMWNRPFQPWNPFSASSKRGLLWPELEGLLFNVVEGKSSDWGTSPWHAYLTAHLAKLVSLPAILIVLGIVADFSSVVARRTGPALPTGPMLLICATHAATMSLLAHKETRFVSYLVPLLNTLGARGALVLWDARLRIQPHVEGARRFSRNQLGLSRLLLAIVLAGSASLTALSLVASAYNYPGGQALAALHRLRSPQYHNASVHIDVLPAMTGVSLFQSVHLDTRHQSRGAFGISWLPCVTCRSRQDNTLVWAYDKTEDLFLPSSDPRIESQRAQARAQLVPTFTYIASDDADCHGLRDFVRITATPQVGGETNDRILPGFPEFRGLRRRKPWPPSVSKLRAALFAPLLPPKAKLGRLFAQAFPLELRWEPAVWLCERRFPG